MRRHPLMAAALAVGASLVLVACGERQPNQKQTRMEQRQQAGTEAWAAGGQSGFRAGEWAPGDQAAWERHMRARSQNQNEYVRIQGRGS